MVPIYSRSGMLFALSLLAVTFAERVTMGARVAPSLSWTKVGPALSNERMTVFAMMRHNKDDVAILEKKLYAVSDPRSPEYGHHLTLAEIGK